MFIKLISEFIHSVNGINLIHNVHQLRETVIVGNFIQY